MNSHDPPSGWQEFLNAAGNEAATARTVAESCGRGLRVCPGARSDRGAGHAPSAETTPEPPTTATGFAGAWNVAQVDHGPTRSATCARARHEYITSKSRS